MYQNNIGIPIFRQFKGLAGAYGNNMNFYMMFFLKGWQYVIQQSGFLGAGGGG